MPSTPIQVWDVPVRLVHWLMVVLIAVSWWTAENGELEYHRYSGYGMLGLLVFRVYWGFAGPQTARFASFVRGPAAIWAYVKGRYAAVPGHTPLGGLSVIALLLLLLAQVSLGLFAVDIDGIESGPLSHLVSFDTGRACAEVHENLFNVLIAVSALHIAAVLFYLVFRRNNLIGPMIHGKRSLPPEVAPPRAELSLPRLIAGIVLACTAVWYII